MFASQIVAFTACRDGVCLMLLLFFSALLEDFGVEPTACGLWRLMPGFYAATGDEKNSHLNKLEKARENLRLFKADLLDYSSIASAVTGCEGVFHVASPVPASQVADPEVELISPAVTGTLNVLRACSEAKVTRVVVVSSVASVIMNPNWPKDMVMDEDCWSDIEYCKAREDWYSVSKTLAESEALEYGRKHESIDSIENRTRSFVDVRDVADALLLVYEKPESSGRYVCAPYQFNISDIVDILKCKYPNLNYPKEYAKGEGMIPMSSDKLKKIGWMPRTFEESVFDSVDYYQEAGLVKGN